jgi:hypothetical protein
MASAVAGWSPVIITGRTPAPGIRPPRRAPRAAAGRSGRPGRPASARARSRRRRRADDVFVAVALRHRQHAQALRGPDRPGRPVQRLGHRSGAAAARQQRLRRALDVGAPAVRRPRRGAACSCACARRRRATRGGAGCARRSAATSMPASAARLQQRGLGGVADPVPVVAGTASLHSAQAHSSSSPPSQARCSRSCMRLSVSVPVLSEQITLTEPSVSTLGRRRTSALARTSRRAPSASSTVTTAGSASGIAATARLIAVSAISSTGSPRSTPMRRSPRRWPARRSTALAEGRQPLLQRRGAVPAWPSSVATWPSWVRRRWPPPARPRGRA